MSELQPKKKGVKPGSKRGPYKKTSVNLSTDQSVNETFERLNKDLNDQKEFNQRLVNEINDVTFENEKLKKDYNDLVKKVAELSTVNTKNIATHPKFVYDPAPVFSAMNRVIAYEIKEGNLKKDSDILQKFTTSAIKYYIQNEFNHILK